MFKTIKRLSLVLVVAALLVCASLPVINAVAFAESDGQTQIVAAAETQAEETSAETEDNSKGSKALAAAIAVGLAAALGAIAMGFAIGKSNEAIARQPEATSQIKSGLMLGLVFIETAIIYALIVAILVIFVL